MSKGNEQALVSLASITGCLVTMGTMNIEDVRVKSLLSAAMECSMIVGRAWYKYFEDNSTNLESMLGKFGPWSSWLETQEELTLGGLASAASSLAQDLEQKLNNPTKKKLVSELKSAIIELEMYVTKDGSLFENLEQGNKIVDKLQELMGWEVTNFIKAPEVK